MSSSQKPWLSVLIPSINPDNLDKLIASMQDNASDWDSGIEFIINGETWSDTVTFSTQFEDMLSRARADWVFNVMDDVTCETKNWDLIFKEVTGFKEDKVILFWPNDKMLESRLACFPVFHRSLAKYIFPLPYRHYKVDDTITHVFPPERRYFLTDVVFRHNAKFSRNPEDGFWLPDGRVYPINREHAAIDNDLWRMEFSRRIQARINLLQLMRED